MNKDNTERAILEGLDKYIEALQSDGWEWVSKWLAKGVLDRKQSVEWADELAKHDMLYHIDDDACDIIWGGGKKVPKSVCRKLDAISGNIQGKNRDAYFGRAIKLNNAAWDAANRGDDAADEAEAAEAARKEAAE